MELEAGKFYRSRAGFMLGPLVGAGKDAWKDDAELRGYWLPNGISANKGWRFDIVAEWADADGPPPLTPEERAAIETQIGVAASPLVAAGNALLSRR